MIWEELVRNLLLAVACVSVTTLVLLADALSSSAVILCVVATLVDVCGFVHFWGLAVDVVVGINIIIAVGLCVDFAAHVAHVFLTQRYTLFCNATICSYSGTTTSINWQRINLTQ